MNILIFGCDSQMIPSTCFFIYYDPIDSAGVAYSNKVELGVSY